jgi:rhodanese-related sulfurtransferase
VTARFTSNGMLAAAALLLGAGAVVAGSPYRSDAERAPAAGAPDAWVPAADGHVSALVVAEWLRERRPGLRVLDLRGVDAYEQFHLSRAEPVVPENLSPEAFAVGETVVVYGTDSVEARLAAAALRERGTEQAYYLADGVGEWLALLNATLSPDAPPEVRAAWKRTAELSRYFGGLPRIGAGAAEPRSTAEVLRRTVRRGCAF